MEDFLILAIGAGVGSAVLAGLLVLLSTRPRRSAGLHAGTPDTVLLFRRGEVVDHTPDARALFDRTVLTGMGWEEVREALVPAFPDLPMVLPDGPARWTSVSVPLAELEAETSGSRLHLRLRYAPDGAASLFRAARINRDYDRLVEMSRHSPDAIWQTDPAGKMTWCNESAERLVAESGKTAPDAAPLDITPPATRSERTTRVSQRTSADKNLWFEVVSRPVDNGWVHYATSIDSLVNAEMAQRNFVQTLTKTFAHLPIGLAVFDRDRQLVLFNPALVDLTHLPVDFLSAKPNLLSFFDHMRENRMMPEPKNYASWRDKLYDVVSAAREDRYCETWNLPSGLTYKITGRPHPDGAVAFLIEDISAEISLTRRFRSELELTQSVLDCFDDSVAVFSRLGVLTFSNSAYRTRWNCDPDSAFAEITIVDATKDWQQACDPSPIWPDLREFVLTLRDRQTWTADLTLKSGGRIRCTVQPVAAGATMVRFSAMAALFDTLGEDSQASETDLPDRKHAVN
ncbi:PAS-domain containing protein [Maliponia aquimaris]|uniref:Sensor protein DivL n=1 Tax=Maliponia aquimaris TaxID=1673631 RepID=A0A238JQV6_9RHOB|nr:PAS-domain containing protein [Maliponia aquimaris]SMX32557.1 Sensor protein DivL [Maliponia aquimaris]